MGLQLPSAQENLRQGIIITPTAAGGTLKDSMKSEQSITDSGSLFGTAAQKIIEDAKAQYNGTKKTPDGSNYVINGSSFCARWVAHTIQRALGKTLHGAGYNGDEMPLTSTSKSNIPAGCCISFYSRNPAGHVGIYDDEGYVISMESGKISRKKLDTMLAGTYYSWRGWSWYDGTSWNSQPQGSYIVGLDTDGSADGGSGGTTGGSSTVVYEHVAETQQWTTLYKNDTKHKAVDQYEVAFHNYYNPEDVVINISEVFSDLTFEDSTADVCTKLSGTIINNKYDKMFEKIKVHTGDKISLKNISTGQTIFSGQIIQLSRSGATGTTSITALDDGRKLTQNKIITQFKNQTCYEVISTAANKAGIGMITCPEFKSTWTGTYNGAASDLIKNALTQISQENGIKYFARVINNTVVIKSYAYDAFEGHQSNVMIPWWRPAENLEPVPCFVLRSEYKFDEDASEVATKVVIAQTQNGCVIEVASAQSPTSIEQWGETQKIVNIDSNETVDASDKAIYELYYGENAYPKHTYSVTVPGSDAVIAGSLIKMLDDNTQTYKTFWVDNISHKYTPTHTMQCSLTEYTDPLTIEQLRTLYGVAEEQDTGVEETEEEEEEEDD